MTIFTSVALPLYGSSDMSFDIPGLDLSKAGTLRINGILWRREIVSTAYKSFGEKAVILRPEEFGALRGAVGVVSTGLANVHKSFSMLDSLDATIAGSDAPFVGGR